MIKFSALLSTFFLLNYGLVQAQSLKSNWSQITESAISEFKNCRNDGSSNINPCAKYIGETFNQLYGINDFYSNEKGRFLVGSEIAKFVDTNDKWEKIGEAYLQENLTKIQEAANNDKAVLAVYLGEDNLGHVSMILPGELTQSGSWGMKVPNSASFFISEPEKSYANKPISYAFTRRMIKDIMLYSRSN
jgi:hypothetical protein